MPPPSRTPRGACPAQSGDRADRVPDRGRPVRDAGHPAVAGAGLWRHAGRHGLGRQRQHDRHGGGRSAGGLLQPPHRPRRRASSSAWRCCRSRPRCWRPAPDLATFTALRIAQGVCHVRGVHADPGLSRRAVQRRRRRRGARRLRHRQRREQPVRPPAVGGGRRSSGPRRQLLRVRAAEPERCRAGLVLARAHAVDDGHGPPRRPRRSRPGPSICATRRCAAASPSAF